MSPAAAMEAEEEMELEDDDVVGGEGFVGEEVIDFDYEFDASRFFDFSREETLMEACDAERWFETAGSYPPSPFIARVSLDELPMEKAGLPEAWNEEENVNVCSVQPDYFTVIPSTNFEECSRGTVLHNLIQKGILRQGRKIANTDHLSRGCTLLKPTASQLAKQRQWQNTNNFNQFGQRSLQDSTENMSQAPKRQKLDNGNFCEIEAVNGVKLKKDFVHKVPQKKTGYANCDSQITRLKLTIPREPELLTAQRALRPRIHVQRSINTKKEQETVRTAHTFKARPLNRKIFEAPSFPKPQKSKPQLPEFKEFRLKTSERAIHHLSTSTPLVGKDNFNKDSNIQASSEVCGISHLQNITTSRSHNPSEPDVCGKPQTEFTALPLDRKEFNFATRKRGYQNLPVDLFSKLSLHSEPQTKTTSRTNFLHLHLPITTKASKENIALRTMQSEIKDKELQTHHPGQLMRPENNGTFSGFQLPTSGSRSLGIR